MTFTEVLETVFPWLLLAFGLVFGSFANVVIWRLPRGESIVRPRSRCPSCGHEIRWYDNIPVVSWVVLCRRCRDCGAAISWRYPVVEALSGVLWALAGLTFGLSLRSIVAVVFFYLLLILSFIDLDTLRLPNRLVITLALFGYGAAAAGQVLHAEAAPLVGLAGSGVFSQPLAGAALGTVLGIGPSLLIAAVYALVRGRSGLGMGDVKLLGAMGPFIGPYVLFAFFGGSILGTFLGVPAALLVRKGGESGDAERGRAKMPFGPFLALGGVLSVLIGPSVLGWYVNLVGL